MTSMNITAAPAQSSYGLDSMEQDCDAAAAKTAVLGTAMGAGLGAAAVKGGEAIFMTPAGAALMTPATGGTDTLAGAALGSVIGGAVGYTLGKASCEIDHATKRLVRDLGADARPANDSVLAAKAHNDFKGLPPVTQTFDATKGTSILNKTSSGDGGPNCADQHESIQDLRTQLKGDRADLEEALKRPSSSLSSGVLGIFQRAPFNTEEKLCRAIADFEKNCDPIEQADAESLVNPKNIPDTDCGRFGLARPPE